MQNKNNMATFFQGYNLGKRTITLTKLTLVARKFSIVWAVKRVFIVDCKGENKAIMILRFPSGNRIKFVLYQCN